MDFPNGFSLSPTYTNARSVLRHLFPEYPKNCICKLDLQSSLVVNCKTVKAKVRGE